MTTTTIKIYRTTKARLDQRRAQNETYDAMINRLLGGKQKTLREQLIAGYQENAARDRALVKEWQTADAPWPPE